MTLGFVGLMDRVDKAKGHKTKETIKYIFSIIVIQVILMI